MLRSPSVTVDVCTLDEWGLCDYEDKTLFVRKTLSENNRIRTLIHEGVHYLNPSFKEDTVLLIERDLYQSLTKADRADLLPHIKVVHTRQK